MRKGVCENSHFLPSSIAGRLVGLSSFAQARDPAFAERKTAIWELAKQASIKLSAYVPPSRHQ